MVRALQQQGRPVRHLRDVAELANDGDPEARRMVRDSGLRAARASPRR